MKYFVPDDVEMLEDSTKFMKKGEKLLLGDSNFVLSVANLEQLPPSTQPEVAFVGRSNVGKSSIINTLTGRNQFAKVSNTPGRTQHLNYFNFKDLIWLVDLPGYGFAEAPLKQVIKWQATMKDYLRGRANLKRVYLLIDSRHGVKKLDEEMMELLTNSGHSFQIVLTKIDKISAKVLDEVIEKTKLVMQKQVACYPRILLTSSSKKLGMENLRASVATLCVN